MYGCSDHDEMKRYADLARSLKRGDIVQYDRGSFHVVLEVIDSDNDWDVLVRTPTDYFHPEEIKATGKKWSWLRMWLYTFWNGK